MKIGKKSALLKTSSALDVKRSGGVVRITGLQEFRVNDLLSVKQIKNKAEVQQVTKVAYSSYTPVGDTKYTVVLINPAFGREGNKLATEKRYSYVTPVSITDLGATAALQREAIHGELIAKINADTRNFVSAATLGTGTGFNITDDAGYYPARVNGSSNGRMGATNVMVATNPDGTGFSQTGNVTVTTAAVYSFGQGSRMDDDAPVMHNYIGNLISGEIDAPVAADGTYATAGQKYDCFAIQCLKTVDIPTISNIIAYQIWEQTVFVDEGTGTSTTNATGFAAFQRAMLRLVADLYKNDPQSTIDFFDVYPTFAADSAAAPTGTTGDINVLHTPYGSIAYHILGAGQTITTPLLDSTGKGLELSLDNTDDEGAEYSAPVVSNSPKSFSAGDHEFSIYARLEISDVSGTDDCAIGFRKKEAYQANIDDYDEMAVLNVISGDIKIETILNNGATTTTDTTLNWADGETHELEVRVFADRTVKFYVDGVDKTGVLAATFSFDADEDLIPFVYFLNAADLTELHIKELMVVPDAYWRL